MSKTKHILGIGDIAIAESPGEIVCYGLGSCVGIFLFDNFFKVGAGAHIALPSDDARNESNIMIDTILHGLMNKGCSRLAIRAKLVGGAGVVGISSNQIGVRNIAYARKKLSESGILIKAEDVGGNVSRTARFDLSTGLISINNSNKEVFTI